MADDIKRGAVRIITDLHSPLAKFDRPGVNNVSRDEVYREVRVLATADLSLARMLDEFDAKIVTMNEGLFDWHREVTFDFVTVNDVLLELRGRIHELERRTLCGRWRRLRAWWERGFEKLETDVVDAVVAIDASTDRATAAERCFRCQHGESDHDANGCLMAACGCVEFDASVRMSETAQ